MNTSTPSAVEDLATPEARAAWIEGFIAGSALAGGHYELYDVRADEYREAKAIALAGGE